MDLAELTPLRLSQMARGKDQRAWEQNGLLAFYLVNALSMSSKAIPLGVFLDPMSQTPRKKLKPSQLREKFEAHVPKAKHKS